MNLACRAAQVLPMISLLATMSACNSSTVYAPAVVKEVVEIGPGKFVVLEKWDWSVDDPANRTGEERTRLKIPYSGKIIQWEGVEIPVVLREDGQCLYMVGYDRETGRRSGQLSAKRFTYYRQEGESLVKIHPDEFPKQIATKNMWVQDVELQEQLELDTGSIGFRLSCTAYIWEELMTGKTSSNSVDESILAEYIRRHSPVSLTVIKQKKKEEERLERGHP
jgi:hypothetical protein